jgi:hypothetical protein
MIVLNNLEKESLKFVSGETTALSSTSLVCIPTETNVIQTLEK